MRGAWLVVALMVVAGASVAAGADGPAPELAPFQGTWDVVRMEKKGKVQPRDPLFPLKQVRYEGDVISGQVARRPFEVTGHIRVDPTAKPKRYDVTVDFGQPDIKPPASPGIYEIDGDTLRICLAAPGNERPTTFGTTADDEQTALVYRRAKAPPKR